MKMDERKTLEEVRKSLNFLIGDLLNYRLVGIDKHATEVKHQLESVVEYINKVLISNKNN